MSHDVETEAKPIAFRKPHTSTECPSWYTQQVTSHVMEMQVNTAVHIQMRVDTNAVLGASFVLDDLNQSQDL